MPYTSKKIASFSALALAGAAACVPAGDGETPPLDRVYFPVGLAVSKASDHLLVINSDFDLQFAQGTVQSLNLTRVREVTQKPCASDGNCSGGQVCDLEPSDENDQNPGYVCVDPKDPLPCGVFGEKSANLRAIAPGRCAPIALVKPADGGPPLIDDAVETSAFATQGLLVSRPCGTAEVPRRCSAGEPASARVASRLGEVFPERLFLPIRGDTALHYVDVDEDGKFVCGRPIERPDLAKSGLSKYPLRCAERYRVSFGATFALNEDDELILTDEPPIPGEDHEEEVDESDPLNQFRFQPEPIDLDSSASGRVVVVSHQVQGVVSTFMNNWVDRPALIHILRNLPPSPIGVTAILSGPLSDGTFMPEEEVDFLLTYRGDPRVDLLHFQDDGLLEESVAADIGVSGNAVKVFRPSTVNSASTTIFTNTSGLHSRGLLVDSRPRQAALSQCDLDDPDCIEEAEAEPLDVYITNRSPNSLLLGLTGGSEFLAKTNQIPRIYDTIPLTAGPARVVMGPITRKDGSIEERIFVICFNDAVIYVFDPVRRVVESEIRTGRGPYAMVFDPILPLAYIAHFTDSYVGVVSLDQRYVQTYGATLATLGTPESPRKGSSQ